jgi:hypothetical protein
LQDHPGAAYQSLEYLYIVDKGILQIEKAARTLWRGRGELLRAATRPRSTIGASNC